MNCNIQKRLTQNSVKKKVENKGKCKKQDVILLMKRTEKNKCITTLRRVLKVYLHTRIFMRGKVRVISNECVSENRNSVHVYYKVCAYLSQDLAVGRELKDVCVRIKLL